MKSLTSKPLSAIVLLCFLTCIMLLLGPPTAKATTTKYVDGHAGIDNNAPDTGTFELQK